jgi:hypothetical protein
VAYATPVNHVVFSTECSSVDLGVNVFGTIVTASSEDEMGETVLERASVHNVGVDDALRNLTDAYGEDHMPSEVTVRAFDRQGNEMREMSEAKENVVTQRLHEHFGESTQMQGQQGQSQQGQSQTQSQGQYQGQGQGQTDAPASTSNQQSAPALTPMPTQQGAPSSQDFSGGVGEGGQPMDGAPQETLGQPQTQGGGQASPSGFAPDQGQQSSQGQDAFVSGEPR